LDEVSCYHFIAVLWSIWRAQNEYLWEHKHVVPTTICRPAMVPCIHPSYNWCCNSPGTTHTPILVSVWESRKRVG
jgi:hypothetical protein